MSQQFWKGRVTGQCVVWNLCCCKLGTRSLQLLAETINPTMQILRVWTGWVGSDRIGSGHGLKVWFHLCPRSWSSFVGYGSLVRKVTHWSEGSPVRKVWNSLQLSDSWPKKTPAIYVTLKVNTLFSVFCTIYDIFWYRIPNVFVEMWRMTVIQIFTLSSNKIAFLSLTSTN